MASARACGRLRTGLAAQVDPGGGPQWLPAGAVLCFSPDDLQLIKGAAGRAAPLSRRCHLPAGSPHTAGLLLDYQKVHVSAQQLSPAGTGRTGAGWPTSPPGTGSWRALAVQDHTRRGGTLPGAHAPLRGGLRGEIIRRRRRHTGSELRYGSAAIEPTGRAGRRETSRSGWSRALAEVVG